jgi:DNA-binding SARP family transcriptional activator
LAIEVRLLGALAIEVDGAPLELGGIRQRSLLALLILNRNRAITADALADSLWPDEQPPTAIKTIQVYVSRLRRLLQAEGGRLESVGAGYRLNLSNGDVDAARFENAVRNASGEARTGNLTAARAQLGSALDLWRGEPLSDLADQPFARMEADRLSELRSFAREELFEVRLLTGEASIVLGDLRKAVSEQPHRERLIGQLMRALYAEGRQTEALAAFHQARRYLADELGVDPGPTLQALEGAILRQELSVSPTAELTSQPEPNVSEHLGRAETYESLPRRLDAGRFATRRTLLVGSAAGALFVVVAVLATTLYRPGAEERSSSSSPTASSPATLASLPRINARLSPGIYQTQLFKPSMTFVLGPGWWTSGDTPGAVGLGPADQPDAEIVFVRIQAVYDGSCPPRTVEIGPAPLDLMDALRGRKDLEVSEPIAVSYGGAIGLQIDLMVTDSCAADQPVPLFQVADRDRFAEPGRRSRLVVLDVDGRTLAADIYALDLDPFWERARGILESFTIDTTR